MLRESLHSHAQRGMGMVEVLVALLVLAVGLLGILSMQARGLQLNQLAYLQSQAMFSAQDIIERIRANQGAILSYDIGLADSTDDTSGPCSDASRCASTDMAAYDLHRWKTEPTRSLPGGKGAVIVGAPSGDLYPVTIQVQYQQGDTYTYQMEVTL